MGLGCLFCKKRMVLFNVNIVYGCTECPVKEKIVNLFGPISEYLSEEDGVCVICILFLNSLMCIKNFMCSTIIDSKVNNNKTLYNNQSFASHYTDFVNSLLKLKAAYWGNSVENAIPSDMLRPLVTSTHTVPHKQSPRKEARQDDVDQEVENTLWKSDRNRPRHHKYSQRSDLKKKPSSRLSTQSEPSLRSKRSRSSTSDSLRYDNGRLLNKRTRSVSRILDGIANKLPGTFKCVDGCTNELDDLTKLTKHKVEDHKMLAKYWCYECHMTKFTSQEDLNLHNNMYHNILISNCFLCSQELQTRQELHQHLEEHRIHSVPCNYCDKFFLDGHTCDKHIKECHKGKRKRIKKARTQTIIDRFDKEDDYYENEDEEYHGPNFSIKMLIQSKEENYISTDEEIFSEPYNLVSDHLITSHSDEAEVQNECFEENANESETTLTRNVQIRQRETDEPKLLNMSIDSNNITERDTNTSLSNGVIFCNTASTDDSDIPENHIDNSNLDDSNIEITKEPNTNHNIETPEVIQEILIENVDDENHAFEEIDGCSEVVNNDHFVDYTDISQEVVIEDVKVSNNKHLNSPLTDECSSIEDKRSVKKKVLIGELKLKNESALDKKKNISTTKLKSNLECPRNEQKEANYVRKSRKSKQKTKLKKLIKKPLLMQFTNDNNTDCEKDKLTIFKNTPNIGNTDDTSPKKNNDVKQDLQIYEFSEEQEDDIKYESKLHQNSARVKNVMKLSKKRSHKRTYIASSSANEHVRKVYRNKKLRKSHRKALEQERKRTKTNNMEASCSKQDTSLDSSSSSGKNQM